MSTVVDLYLRLSEDKTGLEAGVDRQRDECLAYAADRGWVVRHIFIDNDISASKGLLRAEFERLLKANSQAILTWHIDRLVRVSADLERVIELNVNVYAKESGHLDLSNPAGRAVARTITAWSTYEGEQKALRQKAAAAQRARQGRSWWSSRPFGFELDGTHNEAEAEALREAYKALLAGVSLRQIARDLNGAGHLTTRGNHWTGAVFRFVLMNARNTGIRVYGGEEIGPAQWEAIVPEDTYRAAVRLLNNPARRVGGGGVRTHLLSGLARCGKCGETVRAAPRGKKGSDGRYMVYTCKVNSCVSHRAEFTDRLVGSKVVARLSLPDAAERLAPDMSGDVEELRAKAVRLREKIVEARQDHEDDITTRDEFRSTTLSLRERLRETEEALSQAGQGTALEGLLGASDVASVWEGLSMERQRGAIETLVEKVVLRPRGRGRSEMLKTDISVVFRNDESPAPSA